MNGVYTCGKCKAKAEPAPNIEPAEQPEPKFKVGDWLEVKETIDCQNKIHHVLVKRIDNLSDGTFNIVFYRWYSMVFDKSMTYRQYDLVNVDSSYKYQILRILKPSEVVVKISLEGTVCSYSSHGTAFQFNNSKSGCNNIIDYASIDHATAEIVRELVAKQQKGE